MKKSAGDIEKIKTKLKIPSAERMWYVAQALRTGMTVQEIYEHSMIDPWFLNNLREIIEMEEKIKGSRGPSATVSSP